MFNFITKYFTTKKSPTVVVKGWKVGMWVMHGEQIAILTAISIPAEIAIVDSTTGETIKTERVPLGDLRQARYPEIPPVRRLISAEAAKELGYGA